MDQPSSSDQRYRTVFCVDPDHPCLPGHFPGQPLVPGVLLLELVAKALRAWRNQRIARVLEAKFVAPLYPGEQAELQLGEKAGRVRFEILRDSQVLARGVIEGAT
ncbi:hydroxymyristoyl-ACP dehydratase [Dyella flava]|uniref:hydroxymyristoyl-ACP dehydratase n=1 Tax=Dyella flava TaxID=1920170 RepID=UPI0024E04EC8|nr:hydroxymyristoyl-ACP dehydratase [Dyella flava]